VVEDPSDTWSHGLERFATEGTPFVLEQTELCEEGPLRSSLRVRSRSGQSTITSTYLLYDDPTLPLEIRVTVDWHGRHQLLRLCYPVALSSPAFRYEVPYGAIERAADGREYPGQRWVLASAEDGYSVAFANDAKYSYAAAGGTLFITALRSPVIAHHDPFVLDPAATYPYVDQGEQSFTLRLMAGEDIRPRAAHRLADDLLRGPLATAHVSRTGSAAQCASLLELQSGSSTAVWLKLAEDGGDAILRLLEHEGTPDTVTLAPSLDTHTVPAYGLLTLRRNRRGEWHTVNGMEDAPMP
jgi:alpha-mannosidase